MSAVEEGSGETAEQPGRGVGWGCRALPGQHGGIPVTQPTCIAPLAESSLLHSVTRGRRPRNESPRGACVRGDEAFAVSRRTKEDGCCVSGQCPQGPTSTGWGGSPSGHLFPPQQWAFGPGKPKGCFSALALMIEVFHFTPFIGS